MLYAVGNIAGQRAQRIIIFAWRSVESLLHLAHETETTRAAAKLYFAKRVYTSRKWAACTTDWSVNLEALCAPSTFLLFDS
jgi:hypothetical protein